MIHHESPHTLISCQIKPKYIKSVIEPFIKGAYSKIDKSYINQTNSNGIKFFTDNYNIQTLFKRGDNKVKFCAVRKGDADLSDSCKAYNSALAILLDVPESFLKDKEMDAKPEIENEIFGHPISKERSYLEPYKEALSLFKKETEKPKEVRFARENCVTRKAIEVTYNIL